VLDLGCGDGRFARAAAEAGAADVVGVDVAPGAIARAEAASAGTERVRFAVVDDDLPFADASFDLVWCSEVLEHVVDTARLLSEARRVLRTGGPLVVTTPAHGLLRRLGLALGGWDRHFDPRGADLRFYTATALRELLSDFGFEAIVVRGGGGPPGARRHLLGFARRAGLAP
jgi:ubiquinone/menaquinone biosynthesis C-methylase UbiE